MDCIRVASVKYPLRKKWNALAHFGARKQRGVQPILVSRKAPINMPQPKIDAVFQNRRVLPFSSKNNPDFLLRLQLQKEVDRLAILLDEVKKQTERVQTAADAIGDTFLSDQPKDTSAFPASNDGRVPLKTMNER